MAAPNIPEDILIEIFSKIPTKFIGKFRCLSKLWRTRLSTPQFINLHFNHKTHQQNFFLWPKYHSSLNPLSPPVQNDSVSRKQLHLTINCKKIVGSCNGLVLLLNEEDEMVLLNPITLEKVKVPNPDILLENNECFVMYGLGYNNSTDDCEIITLSCPADAYDLAQISLDEFEPIFLDVGTFVNVYSVKRGLWRRVTCPYGSTYIKTLYGTFLNGAIHWWSDTMDSKRMICAYNLADEVFYEVPVDSHVNDDGVEYHLRLFVLDGCLCMLDSFESDRSYLWMMKGYGSEQSWTTFIINIDLEHIDVPLCFIGDNHLVLLLHLMGLVVYNVKNGTVENMVVNGVEPSSFMDIYQDGVTFVDSLVSPASIPLVAEQDE